MLCMELDVSWKGAEVCLEIFEKTNIEMPLQWEIFGDTYPDVVFQKKLLLTTYPIVTFKEGILVFLLKNYSYVTL